MELGRIGLWSGQLGRMPAVRVRALLPEIEGLGFRTIWYPKSVTKEAFSQAVILRAGNCWWPPA